MLIIVRSAIQRRKEDRMDKKALILGGTGAMGTPLVPYLAEKYEVYVTSRKRHDTQNRYIHYLYGNARDKGFLAGILKEGYDVIVDFMSWPQKEFTECVNLLMDSTNQYIFTSSCRVYAQSEEPITEESPRLLDICRDEEYLATSEYALAKAREEDYIMHSGYKNWTIVRPSVTYNTNRLQLGLYEINYWLGRILRGQAVVFSRDLAETLTPMTYGKDVAYAISLLAGNTKSYGEIVQIATPETMKWKEILELYLDVLKDWGGCANLKLLWSRMRKKLQGFQETDGGLNITDFMTVHLSAPK